MSITVEQLYVAILKYIDTEIAQKANTLTKAIIYFVSPSIPKYIVKKVDDIKDSGLVSDIFDEHGNILLDEAYTRAKDAVNKSGKILIPKINYFVDASDIDILYRLIKDN